MRRIHTRGQNADIKDVIKMENILTPMGGGHAQDLSGPDDHSTEETCASCGTHDPGTIWHDYLSSDYRLRVICDVCETSVD